MIRLTSRTVRSSCSASCAGVAGPASSVPGWSVTGISSAMTIGFLAMAFTSMIWGTLSDRLGPRPVVLTALAAGFPPPAELVARSVERYGIIAVVLAMMALLTASQPEYFLTIPNLMNILKQIAMNALLSLGMFLVILTAGIDLSVGSVVCFAMVVGGFLFLAGLDPWSASALAIVACAGIVYSWLPLSPGYNDLALTCSVLAAGAALRIARLAEPYPPLPPTETMFVLLVAAPLEPVWAVAVELAPVLATLLAFPSAIAFPVFPVEPDGPLVAPPAVWAAVPRGAVLEA